MPFRVQEKGITVPTTALPVSQSIKFKDITVVIITNAGATSVWARTDGGIATTAWPSREIPAGQPREFIMTPEDGDAVLSLIAATNPVNCTLRVMTFRSSLVAELVSAAAMLAVLLVQSFWEAVSSTTVKLAGSYTEARMDRLDAKTSANGLSIGPSFPSGGTRIGNTTLTAGQLRAGVDDNNAHIWTSSGHTVTQSGSEAWHSNATDLGPSRLASFPFVAYNSGGANLRHSMTPTDRVRGVTGSALVDAVFDSEKLPIQNGATIAVGDLVEWDNVGANAVVTATAASDRVLGICVAGGTGNVGQSVFATIRYCGLIAALVADVAGVVAGAWLRAGATTPATKCSTVGANEGTFGRAWATAASGATFPARLFGGL